MFFYSEAENQTTGSEPTNIPTTDPYFSNVSLLLKAAGANNSTTFVDSSVNNLAISRFGNTRIDSFSPHNKEDGKWSIYFPSQADSIRKNYLLVNGAIVGGNIGTNWTFETWFRGSSNSQRATIAAKSDMHSDTGNSWVASVMESGTNVGKFYFTVYHGTGWPVNIKSFFSVSRVDDGNWHHLAFVKQGTTYRIFVDGVLELQEVFNTPLNNGTAESITIGGSTPNPNGGDYGRTDCHLSNLRICGTSVYTSAFSPPTTALQSISGTILLTCQGRIFKDNGPNNYSITIGRGSPQISDVSPLANIVTAITGSAYFDGTNDYLSLSNSNLKLSGSYTIETWFYLNSYGDATNGSGLFYNGTTTSNINRVQLAVNLNGSMTANGFGNSQTPIWQFATAAGLVSLNSWNHVALSNDGTTVRLFINGILRGSSLASSIATLPTTFYVGFHRSNSALRYLNGYIDDLRLTQGIARYTTNFTPPDSHPTTGV